MKRTMTTLEVMVLIDSLQAVLQEDSPTGIPPGDGKKAINWMIKLVQDVTPVIVKLQSQFAEHFKPAIDPQINGTSITGAKYKNESAEIELTAAEWRVADKWNEVYEIDDPSDSIVA